MPPHGPRVVVIPFGVPDEGRGLGLGLAALLHGFAQIDGHNIALAQLHRRATEPDAVSRDEHATAPSGPVEAFVPPAAWRDLAGMGNAPGEVEIVVTGAFEPPSTGARGTLELLAFDPKTGAARARVEQALDEARAGEEIVAALTEVCATVGGELGALRAIGDLDWDALESVLRAERCVLHDPARGGPHDRLAAMAHLERALGDAPGSRFAAERLATVALDVAASAPNDPKLAQAALRALSRALGDAPAHPNLIEAMAALLIRTGAPREAERRLNAAIAASPKRARLYTLLSECLRAQGSFEGALAALQAGLAVLPGDALLETERGVAYAQKGDAVAAAASWLAVLGRHEAHPIAFANLAALASARQDASTAHVLVDHALAARDPSVDVLRRAVQLSLASEEEGIARAARIAKLARALVVRAPDDPWAPLVLARSLVLLGEVDAARAELDRIKQLEPHGAAAAEAERIRTALDEPALAAELEAAFRAACSAKPDDLAPIAARARKLATLHGTWVAWLAAAIAHRRAMQWPQAREAAEHALVVAPGCAPAHAELVGVTLALGDAARAAEHAQKVVALEGESPRSLGALARALVASGQRDRAEAALARALAMDPRDEANQRLATRLKEGATEPPPPAAPSPSWADRVRGAWDRLRGR